MSEYLKSAILTAITSFEIAGTILQHNIELLSSKYQFDFRNGYGGVEKFEFLDGEYKNALPLDQASSTPALESTDIDMLLHTQRWFQLVGTMRLSDAIRLYDVAAGIYPGPSAGQACVFTHLDAVLYNNVWPIENEDDRVDPAAAEQLQNLAISLGAHPLTDGFCTQNVECIGDVTTFDGAQLKDSFVNPRNVAEKWANRKLLRHGIVSGIKSELLDLESMRKHGEGCEVFETITGHIIISSLVDLDPSWFEDLDD